MPHPDGQAGSFDLKHRFSPRFRCIFRGNDCNKTATQLCKRTGLHYAMKHLASCVFHKVRDANSSEFVFLRKTKPRLQDRTNIDAVRPIRATRSV